MKQSLEVAEVSLHNPHKNAPKFDLLSIDGELYSNVQLLLRRQGVVWGHQPERTGGKWKIILFVVRWAMKKPHCNPAMTWTVTSFQLVLGHVWLNLSLRLPKAVVRNFGKNPWVSFKGRYQKPHANCQCWLLHEGEVETTRCYGFTPAGKCLDLGFSQR